MLGSPLLHADADSFYASVVMRHHPALRERPMAVVAHVFVASANYPARALGVRGGMPVQEARAKHPELILIDVPWDEVEDAGEALFDIFDSMAEAVEPGSMEEAFLGLGSVGWDEADGVGRELRRRASRDLGIAVSVGVGRTKLMAKLGSRAAKPDGLRVIRGSDELRLRSELPIRDVWGIGGTTRRKLEAIGVDRLADVDEVPSDRLVRVCGTMMANRLLAIRRGTDDAEVRPLGSRTSLSAENATAGYNRRDWTLHEMAEKCVSRIVRRAQKAGLVATGLKIAVLPLGREETTVNLVGPATPAMMDEGAWQEQVARLLTEQPLPAARGLRVTLTGITRQEWAPVPLF